MDNNSVLFAKTAALHKSFEQLKYASNGKISRLQVESLISQYFSLQKQLIEAMPELFSDLPKVHEPEPEGRTPDSGSNLFRYSVIAPLTNSLSYILELRSHYRIGENKMEATRPSRVFISHGHSKEWYKVQAYIEKTLKLETLELAQEANSGRTVLQKLDEESNKCGYSVIVMTGDDIEGNLTKARENVMHEIGFFQGKYGLKNVVLLHEEGTNIPSNIGGLVYIPFPKDSSEAAFGALHGELKVIMGT